MVWAAIQRFAVEAEPAKTSSRENCFLRAQLRGPRGAAPRRKSENRAPTDTIEPVGSGRRPVCKLSPQKLRVEKIFSDGRFWGPRGAAPSPRNIQGVMDPISRRLVQAGTDASSRAKVNGYERREGSVVARELLASCQIPVLSTSFGSSGSPYSPRRSWPTIRSMALAATSSGQSLLTLAMRVAPASASARSGPQVSRSGSPHFRDPPGAEPWLTDRGDDR